MKHKVQLHILVEGRVQGVGFRFFAERQARKYGLVGFVRNLRNGRVEILAEGEKEILENYLEEMRRGPQMAFVTNVTVQWRECCGQYNNFDIIF